MRRKQIESSRAVRYQPFGLNQILELAENFKAFSNVQVMSMSVFVCGYSRAQVTLSNLSHNSP